MFRKCFILISLLISFFWRCNFDDIVKAQAIDKYIVHRPAVTLPAGYDSSLLGITRSGIQAPEIIAHHFIPISQVYNITYSGGNVYFDDKYATLVFKYNKEKLISENFQDTAVFYFDDTGWHRTDKSYNDTQHNQVTAFTSHFTPFVVAAAKTVTKSISQPPPAGIYDDFPNGLDGSGNAEFMIIEDNFMYYQDREYFIEPVENSTVNRTTFEALGLYGAMGIATFNGDLAGGTYPLHKHYRGMDYIVFTAHMDLDVYVLYDTRGGKNANDISHDASWLAAEGFSADLTTNTITTPTRFFIETTDPVGLYTVYRKSVSQGEEVHLHGNRYGTTDPGIDTNYWCILKRQGVYESEPASILCPTSSDTTPPGNITKLHYEMQSDRLVFTWTNPQDPDLERIIVRKSSTTAPYRISDGDESDSYELLENSFSDLDVTPGGVYYYTFFCLDANRNYLEGGISVRINFQGDPPALRWEMKYGDAYRDFFGSIKETADHGYIAVGASCSGDGDLTATPYYSDVWVMKLDQNRNIEWQRLLGGSAYDIAYDIEQTPDGGYILAGSTCSNDGDVSGNRGNIDIWVVKLDPSGVIEWQRCYGGSKDERGQSINLTNDGGFIVCGTTESDNNDVTGHIMRKDIWVVKINATGTIQWQKCIGGSSNDFGYVAHQTIDGGYIIGGYTVSNDGDVAGIHGGANTFPDYLAVKLDYSGKTEWSHCYGGSRMDTLTNIIQCSDGGYVMIGYTQSSDGDVSSNHGLDDIWVVKTDLSGNIVWEHCFGGSKSESAYGILEATDGGYIIAGSTSSNDGDFIYQQQTQKIWIFKLTLAGNLEWQQSVFQIGSQGSYSIENTSDNGFIIAAITSIHDRNISREDYDGWIIKLGPEM